MNRSCKGLALAGLLALSIGCSRTQNEPLPETKSEPKPAESKAAEVKPAAAEGKPVESKPVEAKPVASFGAAPAGAGAFRSADEAYDATMAFFRKMIAIVDAGGTDCAKIGTGLKSLTAEQAQWTARLRASQGDEALRKEMATKSGKKIEDAVRPSMTTLTKCTANADVKAFLDGMQ
jgi:hypothetical protein